jgi:hypothetical protein
LALTAGGNMKISKAMLKGHIGIIMSHWIMENGIPPETSDEYAPYMSELEESLTYTSDLVAFQCGIDFLLSHPEVDITFLNSSEYDWEDDEIRQLLIYIREKLWSNLNLTYSEVELVDMPIQEWRSLQETL